MYIQYMVMRVSVYIINVIDIIILCNLQEDKIIISISVVIIRS